MWRIFPPKDLEKIRALKIRMRQFFFLKKKVKLCIIYIANEMNTFYLLSSCIMKVNKVLSLVSFIVFSNKPQTFCIQ